MRILFFGDIVGKNGRNAIKRNLGLLKSKFRADLVIANGENATHGKGLIENHYNELIEAGIDIITLGNHYLSKSEITEYIQHANRLVRPLNIKSDIVKNKFASQCKIIGHPCNHIYHRKYENIVAVKV